jgi:hypothetical protein
VHTDQSIRAEIVKTLIHEMDELARCVLLSGRSRDLHLIEDIAAIPTRPQLAAFHIGCGTVH